jgi:sec-independent protein translocase protein TatC
MIYTSLTEAFFTYLKLAIFAAFFVTFPFLAAQFYLFLAPGLYKHEKNALLPFLIAAPVLFLSGAALVYFAVMPLAWEFFLSFETSNAALPIKLEAKIDQYLSLVMSLIIGFGVAFQFPVIIMLLAKVGVVNAAQLKKNRKYAIVLIAIISALLTPPDVISQLLMLTSLCALYELSIFGCKFYSKPSK